MLVEGASRFLKRVFQMTKDPELAPIVRANSSLIAKAVRSM